MNVSSVTVNLVNLRSPLNPGEITYKQKLRETVFYRYRAKKSSTIEHQYILLCYTLQQYHQCLWCEISSRQYI